MYVMVCIYYSQMENSYMTHHFNKGGGGVDPHKSSLTPPFLFKFLYQVLKLFFSLNLGLLCSS